MINTARILNYSARLCNDFQTCAWYNACHILLLSSKNRGKLLMENLLNLSYIVIALVFAATAWVWKNKPELKKYAIIAMVTSFAFLLVANNMHAAEVKRLEEQSRMESESIALAESESESIRQSEEESSRILSESISESKVAESKSQEESRRKAESESKAEAIKNAREKSIAESKAKEESESIEESKNQDPSNYYDATFEELMRDESAWKGYKVKFYGKVLQVQTEDKFIVYRIGTEGSYYSQGDFYVVLPKDKMTGKRILEDDRVTVYGTFVNVTSYKTVLKATREVPLVLAHHIDIE